MNNQKEQLKGEVLLVQDFDKLCDDLVEECKYMLEHYDIEEEEYTVVQKRNVLVEK